MTDVGEVVRGALPIYCASEGAQYQKNIVIPVVWWRLAVNWGFAVGARTNALRAYVQRITWPFLTRHIRKKAAGPLRHRGGCIAFHSAGTRLIAPCSRYSTL